MAYVYQPYPKHLHRPDGSYKVVENDAERDAALAEGWNLKPGTHLHWSEVPPKSEPVAVPKSQAEPEKRKRGRPKKKG